MEKTRQVVEDARARAQDLLEHLEDLDRKVATAETRLRTLKSEETAFLAAREKKEKEKVSGLESENTRLENRLNTLRTDVSSLEEKREKFASQVAELRPQLVEIKSTAESVLKAFADKSYRQ